MRVDSNTQGHRQWFFFSMKNQKPCTVRLNLFRFKKVYSLFQRGMKPYVRSRKARSDWQPGGKHIKYHYERQPPTYGPNKPIKTFVLSFSINFQHANDQIFIASGIPYSCTFLNKQLTLYKNIALRNENLVFEVSDLTKSLCGLTLPLISVYNSMAKLVQRAPKRFIIINARTHAGEASSSWVMDGFLRELASNQSIAEWMLNQNIEFRLIPMLNPDGVMIGNYRTGIIGDDLNRKFRTSRHEYYPQILALKKLVASSKREGQVELFLDLHGHSILKNSFIYGPPEQTSSEFRMKNLAYHLFHNSKYFRLGSCRFRSENSSTETARLYFQQQQKILSFTCENSLGLYYTQQQTLQMLGSDWQAFGQSILHSMRDIFSGREVAIPQINSTSNFKQVSTKISNQTEYFRKFHPKSTKNQKVFFKIPEKESLRQIQQQSKNELSLLTSSRQDEHLDLALKSKGRVILSKLKDDQDEQSSDIKLRRKSEIVTNKSRVFHELLRKREDLKGEKDKSQFIFERSSTCDNANQFLKQINSIQELEEQNSGDISKYEVEAIKQNFSEDYSSINDEDSSGDDLPSQEKNYVLDYIKMNQRQVDEGLPSENKVNKTKSKDFRNSKISKFRQIRFKSIEEMNQEVDFSRQSCRNQIKKLKLEPHKFKDATTKSLLNKYNQSLGESQFDDPAVLSISQQKRLIQRTTLCRRAQKDPFVLIHRQEKVSRKY